MKTLFLSFLFFVPVIILSTGCQMEPKEIITIVAPQGTTYGCYIDGESVGDVDEKGVEVKVDPGTHTISWTRDSETIEVTALLPVTDSLLRELIGITDGTILAVYRSWEDISRFGTANDAGRGAYPVGSISYGETFEASLNVPNSCAQIKSNVECTAGLPFTFLAEVHIDIFKECIQEENEGEEEGEVEKMNYKIKPLASEPLISRLTDSLKLFFKSSIGK